MSTNVFKKALNESGVKEDISTYDTFISMPANNINLPEISNISSDFIYNFFTKDERVRKSSSNILSFDVTNSDEVLYRIRNKFIPRYVKVKFDPPRINPEFINNFNYAETSFEISENLDKIIVEGASSNEIFSGIEILDTGRENKIYTMLKGSSYFQQLPTVNSKNSQKESAEKLYNTLKEKGGLFGNDKKLILESLSNIESEGYRLGQSDVPLEIANYSSDPIGKQTFSVQFNNLLMSELIEYSTVIPDNVFQDELRSLKPFANRIRSKLINSISKDDDLDPADYELEVKAINISSISQTPWDNNEFPQINFIGYIVEKFENLPDESVEFVGRKFVPGHQTNYFIDEDVRYGGSYFYKIRTLCKVKMIVRKDDIFDASLTENVLATMLMASEGVLSSVYCQEFEPPKPPNRLNIVFNNQTLLPRLTWCFPLNKQRDIKRFQIFKRLSIDKPFVLIGEIDFDDSIIKGSFPEVAIDKNYYKFDYPVTYFVDKTHNDGEKPIYAICSVDAHGMSSNYSAQIQFERDRYTNRVKRTIISKENAPKPYPNLFLEFDSFKDTIKISGYKRCKLFLDPDAYDVLQYIRNNDTNISAIDLQTGNIAERSLNLLAIDENNPRYKMQIINIDNQKDSIVSIKLTNRASPGPLTEDMFNVSVASLSENNLSFQYGINS